MTLEILRIAYQKPVPEYVLVDDLTILDDVNSPAVDCPGQLLVPECYTFARARNTAIRLTGIRYKRDTTYGRVVLAPMPRTLQVKHMPTGRTSVVTSERRQHFGRHA